MKRRYAPSAAAVSIREIGASGCSSPIHTASGLRWSEAEVRHGREISWPTTVYCFWTNCRSSTVVYSMAYGNRLSGEITISRTSQQAGISGTFPADYGNESLPMRILGYAGGKQMPLQCRSIQRYRNRLSGPLLDRIDMHRSPGRCLLRAGWRGPEGENPVPDQTAGGALSFPATGAGRRVSAAQRRQARRNQVKLPTRRRTAAQALLPPWTAASVWREQFPSGVIGWVSGYPTSEAGLATAGSPGGY